MIAIVRSLWATRLLLVLGAVLPLSCSKRLSPPAPEFLSEVQYAGCDAVKAGPVCLFSDKPRQLDLWWPATLGDLKAASTSQGPLVRPETKREQGGWMTQIMVPASAQWLQLDFAGTARPRRHRLPMALYPAVPALQTAARRQTAGDLEGAMAALREGLDQAQGLQKARLQAALARLALQTQAIDAAIAALRESMKEAAAQGLISQQLKDAVALSYALLNYRQDYAGARAVIAEARPMAATVPEHLVALRYNEGGIASQVGDMGEAISAFRESAERAQKLGRDALARAAQRNGAATLRLLGRSDEALAMQRALVDGPTDTPCDASDDRLNLALSLLSAARAQNAPPNSEPQQLLQQAHAALSACADPFRERNLWIERLLLAVQSNDLAEMKTAEAALLSGQEGQSPLLHVWQLDALARLALWRSQWQSALQLFESELQLAQRLGLAQERFRAWVGKGTAYKLGKRRREAVAAFQQAEAALDALAQQIPLGQGVASFVRDHQQSVQELVQALLDMGHVPAAMDAVRVAQARAFLLAAQAPQVAQLPEARRKQWEDALARYHQLRANLESRRAQWDVTAEDQRQHDDANAPERTAVEKALEAVYRTLRPQGAPTRTSLRKPGANEAYLVYFRSQAGWLAFVSTGQASRVVQIPEVSSDLDAETLSEILLQPFAPELAKVTRITLLPPPALWHIDFAALPWRGKPLAHHAWVQYKLDVCQNERDCGGGAPKQDRPSALVISDPKLDLQGARREAESVSEPLVKAGYLVNALAGSEASHARVLEALSQANLLHYAGHGTHAGIDAEQSALLLGQDTRLLLGDILSLAKVPRRVVLSACEGASLDQRVGGLSLAHAFVAAGSSVVIAAVREVSDTSARSLIQTMYELGAADPQRHPGQVLSEAQRQLAAQGASHDLWAFRAVVP